MEYYYIIRKDIVMDEQSNVLNLIEKHNELSYYSMYLSIGEFDRDHIIHDIISSENVDNK